MAQNPGFKIIPCEAPSEELQAAATAEVQKNLEGLDESQKASESLGFKIITCEAPSEELQAAATAEVQKNLEELDESQKASESLGFIALKEGKKCLELLRHGWHRKKVFGEHDIIAVQNYAVLFAQNNKPISRSRAFPGRIVFIKPINETLKTTNGLFKIYPGSHLWEGVRDAGDTEPSEISLQLNEVLMIDGNIVIEHPCQGGSVASMEVWRKK